MHLDHDNAAAAWPVSGVSGSSQGRSPLERLAARIRGEFDDRTDWLETIATANEHLVGPYLNRALRRRDRAGWEDADAMNYLALLDAANVERNRQIAEQLQEVATAMNAAGIHPLVIKGAAILARLDDPASTARMISDLDIVCDNVAPSAMDRSLRELGYSVVEGTTRGHSAGSYWREGTVSAVDLHSALPTQIARIIPDRDLEERTQAVKFRQTNIRVPDPSLHLAINLGHEMLHDQGNFSGLLELRYLLEIVEFTECNRSALDWSWLAEKCGNWRFALAVELQSRMAIRLFGKNPFPGCRRSALGAVLHHRRLLKARLHMLEHLKSVAMNRVLQLTE